MTTSRLLANHISSKRLSSSTRIREAGFKHSHSIQNARTIAFATTTRIKDGNLTTIRSLQNPTSQINSPYPCNHLIGPSLCRWFSSETDTSIFGRDSNKNEDNTEQMEHTTVQDAISNIDPQEFSRMNPGQLEKVVLEIESLASPLESSFAYEIIFPLMVSCANLRSIPGNVLAERLLSRCITEESTPEIPTVQMYNIVLNSWAKLSNPRNSRDRTKQNPAQRAQLIFDLMHSEYFNSDKEAARPDRHNYATLMSAWSNSGDRYAPDKMHHLLQTMEDSVLEHRENPFDENILLVEPDTACYNTILSAVAQSRDPEKAESFLNRMVENYVQTRDPSRKPDVRSYSIVISAYGKKASKMSPRHASACAEMLLQQMQSPPLEIVPDRMIYNTVISCLAKGGNVERASAMMDHMVSVNVRPNVVTYNTLLHAYAINATEGNDTIVDQILDQMTSDGIKPDTVTWNTVMNAYSTSHTPVHKIQSIFDQILQPNIISHAILIQSHAQHLDPQRSLDILQSMLQNPDLPDPNLRCFQDIIAGFINTDQVHRAQSILDWMTQEVSRSQPHLQPTTYLCNMVMEGWSVKHSPPTPQNLLSAQMVLQNLHERYKTTGKKELRPNVQSYNIVLRGYLRNALGGEDGQSTSSSMLERTQFFQKALNVYNQCCSVAKPDDETYKVMLDVVIMFLVESNHEEEKIKFVKHLVTNCAKDGWMDKEILQKVEEIVTKGRMKEVVDRWKDGKSNLPVSWIRNARKKENEIDSSRN